MRPAHTGGSTAARSLASAWYTRRRPPGLTTTRSSLRPMTSVRSRQIVEKSGQGRDLLARQVGEVADVEAEEVDVVDGREVRGLGRADPAQVGLAQLVASSGGPAPELHAAPAQGLHHVVAQRHVR